MVTLPLFYLIYVKKLNFPRDLVKTHLRVVEITETRKNVIG